jgi:hypothetical protein
MSIYINFTCACYVRRSHIIANKQRIASLPIKCGGLGLYLAVEAADMLLWPPGSNLGCYKIIYWETVEYVVWTLILTMLWTVLIRSTILTVDFSNFASKDTVLRKAHHVLVSVLFDKIVQNMEVDFDITIRQKTVLDVWKQHMLKILLCLFPSTG